jgi:pimeloyl-ACP methyl ester carboxylesterase
VQLLDFTPMESIMAATAGMAKLFSREHELGKIQPGFYADCILVDGNPLQDIGILQNHEKLSVIMINGKLHKIANQSSLPLNTVPQSISFPHIVDKQINVEKIGNGPDAIVCVHGLGGSIDCWRPLIRNASLAESHTVLLYDIEGHGLTPLANNASPTIDTYADDLLAVLQANRIDSATIIAHSLGCMIATVFALKNPMRVKKLVLLSPLPMPFTSEATSGLLQRAALVRRNGMKSIVDAVAEGGVSEQSRQHRPVAMSAIRFNLLGCDPVGYSKLCVAATRCVGSTWSYTKLPMTTLLVAGAEDVPSSQLLQSLKKDMQNSIAKIAEGCGHWLVYEDEPSIAQAVKDFIQV